MHQKWFCGTDEKGIELEESIDLVDLLEESVGIVSEPLRLMCTSVVRLYEKYQQPTNVIDVNGW